MDFSFFSILILSLVSSIFGQPNGPAPSCDAGHANQQITSQNALYWCGSDGKLMPIACLAPDGSRIDIGASFWTDTAVVECRQQSDSNIQTAFVACLKDGRRVDVDQSLNDGKFFYKCVRQSTDGALQLKATGCVGAGGKEVPPGQQVTQDSFVFTCAIDGASNPSGGNGAKPTVGQPGPPATQPPAQQPMPAVGCLFDGKQYKMEDDMELSGTWYKCTTDPLTGQPTTVLVGCIINSTKYAIGDTWKNEFIAFRCEKINGFVMGSPYACVERYPNGTVAEYQPGRKWIVGSGEFNRYVITCAKQGMQISRKAIACFYMTNEGKGVLDAGCMKQVGQVRIQCWPPGTDSGSGDGHGTPNVRIRITNNPVSQDDENRFAASGVHTCESKPLESVIN